MSAIEEAISAGERSIGAMLDNANALTAEIASSFPPMSLDEVHAKFAKAPKAEDVKGGVGLNPDVVKLCGKVRQHAAAAVEEFHNAQMWLYMKVPSVSDGNNFGVDVQNYVNTEIGAMITKLEAMLGALSDYHWQRGTGIEKLPGSKSSESTTNESTETEDKDGEKKTTSKTSKASSTKASKEIGVEDFVQYTIALDVKAYHKAYLQLTEIRNCYVKASALFTKNMKRLADPRGEGEDGGQNRNVMSMF